MYPNIAVHHNAMMAEEAKWPDAAPVEGKQTIFTISCGNTHLHWASHDVILSSNNANNYDVFAPTLFWRTPHISDEDMTDKEGGKENATARQEASNDNNGSLVGVLSRMLPESPHDYIFGEAAADLPNGTTDAAAVVTEEMALDQSQKRSVEKISIYVVSSNADQLTKLQKIFASVPSNFVVLDGNDFFTKEQGRYDGMGTDRLATLFGAVYLHGNPALVFDGGTATTYAATNRVGRLLGGGIGPGIQSKLCSMSNHTDALPKITANEVLHRVKEAEVSGKPLPTFARETKEAMMVDIFQEYAGKGRNVIEKWLEHAYDVIDDDDQKQPPKGTKYNDKRIVTCTGGDGDILHGLLQPFYGGVIEPPTTPTASQGKKLKYEVQLHKHLIHYGITAVLKMRFLAKNKAKFSNTGETHVGKRVAKVFDVETDDGDNIFRGSVAKEIVIEGGEKNYRINYDDGDAEDVSNESLIDMLDLYKQYGEKKRAESKPKHGKKKTTEAKPKINTKDKSNINTDDKKPQSLLAPEFPMKSAPKKHTSGVAESGKVPAAKKARTKDDVKDMVQSSDPKSFVNKRVAKDFDGVCFFGKITKYDDTEPPPFWHVVYDDGDEEDYTSRDLIKALKHYKKQGKDDKNAAD